MPDQSVIDQEANQSDLAAQVAAMRAELDLLRSNILGPAYFRPGLLRFGRNIMELDNFGVQFKTDAATPLGSLYWPGDLQNTDPSAVYPRAEISGYRTAGASYLQNLAYTNSTNYALAYVFSGIATNPQVVMKSVTPSYSAGISTAARESAAFAYMELLGSVFTDITALTQITADQNDYAAGAAYRSAVSISSDAARNITGIDATNVQDGGHLFIQNTGSFAITLKDESASSTAANRFALTGDVVLNPDSACHLQYNATSSRWRAIAAPASGGVATDTIWDAKGDLAVGTGADTAAKLSVGTDGKRLTANSVNGGSTGLLWDTFFGSSVNINGGPGSSSISSFQKYVRFTSLTGNMTATLYSASTIGAGDCVLIKRIDTSGYTATVDANGTETIDGALSITLAPYESVLLVSDGSTNWEVN